ncbi:NADP-dependent isocitrate dehydrogenase [Alkalicoccus chagannorensis]|uniref:NADP-dependent isocitrate dehydrogenase n=1 Tax=Alkalicoccus chagannorensis TaxID=427072 RepID=UPI0003F5F660|nr:NADP-dependent isocitrate dehydrogenase [Alkalicoccus chagannorensis]
MGRTPITVAYGDGIGPEIMEAVLHVMERAEAPVDPETIQIGKEQFEAGWTSGIPDEAWESLRRTGVFLKAPITTPQGGGYKSLNVTIRTTLGLYANIRPSMSYHPFISTKHPDMDLVVVRENEEDLYTGIEHRQTPEVVQSVKLISRPGSERVIRHAFDYARENDRKKVTCITKDNIMKLSDGLFHQVFEEVAEEYPEIETEHQIVDIGLANIADRPQHFDVVVLPNLYGDIASDIAAQISGGVGLAGSSNIGDQHAMFEAIHGSAPDITGKGIANPSGLLHGAVQMLQHIGEPETAERIHNAWFKTLEDGVGTPDIAQGEGVSTMDFARAVADRLGQEPGQIEPVRYAKQERKSKNYVPPQVFDRPNDVKRELTGVDVHVCADDIEAEDLGQQLEAAAGAGWSLSVITNRGANAYPQSGDKVFTTDHWRCRFYPSGDDVLTNGDIRRLLEVVEAAGLDWIKVDNLYDFDGIPGYSEAKK